MKPGGGPSEAHSSLIVQLNPYGPAGSVSRGTIIPPRSQARHKLPMSPTGPRILPARNISALARPLPKLMSSPKKIREEEIIDVIDRKYNKPQYKQLLPNDYQHSLQDHNYCKTPLPQPHPKPVFSPKIPTVQPNGISLPNGTRPPTVIPVVSTYRPVYSRVITPDTRISIKKDDESDISSDDDNATGNTEDGEETETAPEDEDSVTRCICEFQHDDGYMICCDQCLVWQHVDCMGIERNNIPDEYKCEECEPRKVDKAHAISLQKSKRNQFNDSSDSLESSSANTPPSKTTRNNSNNNNAKKATLTTRTVTARKRSERDSYKDNSNSARSVTGSNTKPGRVKIVENKRGKYTKPPIKQKHKKNTTKKTKEIPVEKVSLPSPELRSSSPVEGVILHHHWVDSYEEAVTNHYSQELRARISSIKVNGLHSESRLASSLSGAPKSRLSLLTSGIKVLISSTLIPANQAIVEIRGKYMLVKGPSTSGTGKPFVFHHRINGPGSEFTDVQVDSTTYGNDTRFMRSSCSPNAEIRHCIEKGTLHLYVVSITTIEAKKEITIPHRPGAANCDLGDKCNISASSINDKRRRGRRRTLSESSTISKPSNNNNNNITKEPPIPNRKQAIQPTSPESTKSSKNSYNATPSPPLTRESSTIKFTRGQVSSRRATLVPTVKTEERKRNVSSSPPKKHDGKLTRDERKLEAIMKAFERLEKDEQKKQSTSGTTFGRMRKSSSSVSPVREKIEKPPQKKKFRETRATKPLRPRRNASSKISVTLTRRSTRRRARSEESESEESDTASVGGSPPSSPPPRTPPIPDHPVYEATPMKDEETTALDTVNSSGSESTPPPAVSNACLLVAAAVGPLAPGFKFPKTKKNFINTWQGGNEINNEEVAQRPGVIPLDCAKKRWLRQAISEDSDSPKHETGVSSPTDASAPPKKRRLARESMTSENVPTTSQPSENQTQVYEYDENSMDTNALNGEFNMNTDNQKDFDQMPQGGPKTPPPITDADSNSITSNNKLLSPSNSDEQKEKITQITKEEANKVKRKLSISEYRERVKSNPPKASDMNQSTQSTLRITTSVEDIEAVTDDFLPNSFLFNVPAPPIDPALKKGSIVSGAGFNAAPTLVEQQREALSERLRREFGLMISDDEEDKNKKGILGGDNIPPTADVKKIRKPLPPPLSGVGQPPPTSQTSEFFCYQRPTQSKLHWTS